MTNEMAHDNPPLPPPDANPVAATHRSLERGLAVLQTVAEAGRPIALAETARRLGLHRSTAHHLMQTLVRTGYLRQQERSRAYELTQKLFQLTGRTWTAEELGEIAHPLLEELTRATGEGSSVAMWVNNGVTIAAKREPDGPVRVVQDTRAARPLHCTAVGKALAAWLPREQVLAALAKTPMERRTPRTITTADAFEAELHRIRSAGYAVDDEEQYEGLRCVAMPVFAYTGQVLASMSVIGPKHRMTQQKLMAVRTPLEVLSRRLSERLGFNSSPGAPRPKPTEDGS